METTLEYDLYRDKIYAGWMGKSIGGTVGAPAENQKTRLDYTRDTLWPEIVYPNDDLDIQVVWLELLQERGVWLTHEDLVDYWQDRCWYNFCEYGVFLHNVQRGIMPPVSGWWNNRFFRESEGSPIRSEIWGMIAPGNPALAASYAKLDSELDHAGNSVWSEMFLSGMAAAAFVAREIDGVIEAGLSTIPPDCDIARMVREVIDVCERASGWEEAWRRIIRHYGNRDASKAITNQALVVMALKLSRGDFADAMVLTCNSGWDTDCTAATTGALLGILHGRKGLPADWVARMGETLACDVAVRHKHASFETVAEDTARVGVEMAALRNDRIELKGAPAVAPRGRVAAPVTLHVRYLDEPVLRHARSTPLELSVRNQRAETITGSLVLSGPDDVRIVPGSVRFEIPAGEVGREVVEVRHHGDIVWDKNLLTASWEDDAGTTVERTFGLGGARQWRVYGPYWDMWDTTKHEVCPYNNDEVIICPSRLPGYVGDAWNQYVRLDRAYLDEAQLLKASMPEELPVVVEVGEDALTGSDLAGFVGQACFYLVRTLVAPKRMRANLTLGSSASLAVWLDGEEVYRRDEPRAWAPQDVSVPVTLGPKPRRLVVKLARQGDSMTFSLFPSKIDVPGDKTRGHSMILDVVGDVVWADSDESDDVDCDRRSKR